MKIILILFFSYLGYSTLRGQNVDTVTVSRSYYTVAFRTRLKDTVEMPSMIGSDSISFSKIRDLFGNCMDAIPKDAGYEVFVKFWFDIDEKGSIPSITTFEYSKRLSKELSSFDTAKLLCSIPKKWNPAVIKKGEKPVLFQIRGWLLFNREQMSIEFLTQENEFLFPKVQLPR
jgi:hypothetical protein